MKKVILLLLLLTRLLCSTAQYRNAIGANFIYGTNVSGECGSYKGVSFAYQMGTVNSDAEWVRILNIKNINIEAAFHDKGNTKAGPLLTNKDCFGSDITLSAGLDISVLDLDAFKILFSPGIGTMYTTKTYFNTGGVNQVFGCHWNVVESAWLKFIVPVTDELNMQVGTGMLHASNSNLSSLNQGLNRIESFIGFSQQLDYPQIHKPKFSLADNALSVEMIAGYTTQVTTGFYQLNGVNLQLDRSCRKPAAPLTKAAISISYSHAINPVFGVKAGTDMVYSAKLSPLGSSTSDTTRFIETYQGKYTAVYHHLNIGLSAGFDVRLGRLVFSAGYGYYLGGYESYTYCNGGDRFSYGREFYLTFTGRYFLTPNLALEAKSFLYNFGGAGVNLSF